MRRNLSNLALADLKRLPPGTLPPVVLKFDASSLPVCLIAVRGKGMSETQLHDQAQFNIRNQIAVVKGAEIPPPFGGKYRQVMVYVDPYKLMSRQMSPMDVVNAVNNQSLILPAGEVDTSNDITPLIAATHLQGTTIATVQLGEIHPL